jgi:serine/threonine-protein kinase
MSERPPDDQTVDLTSEAALDAGLAAAFGPDSGPPPTDTSALEGLLADAPQMRLRDTEAETPVPLLSPAAAGMPLPQGASDRYRFLGEIAHGGMGSVLQGHDPHLNRDIAVKVLLEKHQGKPVLLRRFVEEAQIAGQLQHPGVVPVYELGQLPAPDRRPYFTMKLVRGRTLAKLLAERAGPGQDRPRFLKIFEQVCQTVAFAHSKGVIHRDLKPANVMVGAFGEVQVMDWGLAKVLPEGGPGTDEGPPRSESSAIRTVRTAAPAPDEGADSHTVAGSVLGTPAYMAPEQARGDVELIDERADVFGLGAILCEVLTGQPPFDGKPAEAQAKAQAGRLEGAYARLEGCGADAELVGLARRCLAAAPADRPRNAEAVAEAVTGYLNSVAERLHRAELERAAADARAEEEARTRQMAEAKAAEERKRHRLTVALAAALVLLLLGGGGAGVWYRQRQAETARQVEQALGEAKVYRALAEPTGDLARWAEALAAAKRAEALAVSGGAPDLVDRAAGSRRDVEAAAGQARERAEQAEKDRRLIAQMLDIRSGAGDRMEGYNQGFAGADALYAQALRDYGIDADALSPGQTRDWLAKLGDGARVELAACLDDWAHARRLTNKPDGAKRLTEVARLLDPDPLRNKVRVAIDAADLKALQELAARPEAQAAPPPTVNLLAVYLGFGGDVPGALRLLAAAQRRHPGDFQINHNLAWFSLYRSQPPRPFEALRFSTAAVAVRPQSVIARLVQAEAYARRGNPAAGAAVLEELARSRQEASLYVQLGAFHLRHGNREAALAAQREALRLDPNDARARTLLSQAPQAPAAPAVAAAAEKALASPTTDLARTNLLRALAAVGRLEEARAAWAKALARGPVAHDAWYGYAELCLYLGLTEEYRRHRRDLLARFGKAGMPGDSDRVRLGPVTVTVPGSAAAQPAVAERVGRACLLLPATDDELRQAEALIDRAMTAGPQHPSYPHFQWAKGLAEYRRGRPEQAVPLLRASAARIQQQTPRLVLAMALFECGHKEEARRELADVTRKYDWRPVAAFSVDDWLHHVLRREAEALMVPNLAGFLWGEFRPRDNRERWELIARCLFRTRYAAVAGLYADAFADAAKGATDLGAAHRYRAARAAALAGTGHGEAAPSPEGPEAARWRRQALDWLRADLPVYGKLLETGRVDNRLGVLRVMRAWEQDRALAGLRDPEEVRKLSAGEQAGCKQFWEEIEALRKRAEAAGAAQGPG